jgi:hypothetical protein
MIDFKRISMGTVVSVALAVGGSAAAGPNLSSVASGLTATGLVNTASFEAIRCEGDDCLRTGPTVGTNSELPSLPTSVRHQHTL